MANLYFSVVELHETYMKRCLELAEKGCGHVAPNPMVGCVIVYNNQIIGEGYHEMYGRPHAEVNAINSVKNKDHLKKSTLYVSLEPCAHHGLTPPCSDLIIASLIPHVVVGVVDPFVKVSGMGIEKMRNNGIVVEVGILEKQCRDLNKRFFTCQEKSRPLVILKWAETTDGFIDFNRDSGQHGQPTWITGEKALVKVHQMRALEDAILVGTITALKDNPSLTVRHCEGKNPVRIVIDKLLSLPGTLNLFDNSTRTLVFNSIKDSKNRKTELIRIDFGSNIIPQILNVLFEMKIQSLIVEGGKQTLESFMTSGFWDEAHRFIGNKNFGSGVKAPSVHGTPVIAEEIGDDKLLIYKNNNQ